MYIVIIGGGRIGYYLSKALLAEGHEILIVEMSDMLCRTINDELGSVCYCGDGCEAAVQAEVGVNRADMLVAVTGDDEDNLVACQVAKHKFNVPRTIARIRNPNNENLFKKLGIDVTVSGTSIIMEAIEKEVPTHPLVHLMEMQEKGLEIVDVKMAEESPMIGKKVKELHLPADTVLALVIRRASKPVVPNGETILEEGDHVIAVTPSESEEPLRLALRGG